MALGNPGVPLPGAPHQSSVSDVECMRRPCGCAGCTDKPARGLETQRETPAKLRLRLRAVQTKSFITPPQIIVALIIRIRFFLPLYPSIRGQNLLGVLYLLLPSRPAAAAAAAAATHAGKSALAPPSAHGGELAKALWHASAGISSFVYWQRIWMEGAAALAGAGGLSKLLPPLTGVASIVKLAGALGSLAAAAAGAGWAQIVSHGACARRAAALAVPCLHCSALLRRLRSFVTAGLFFLSSPVVPRLRLPLFFSIPSELPVTLD